MAFIFQSNAEKYSAPGEFVPGQIDSWRVTRYVDKLYKGALILLWEAQGKATEPVRGVWGWGISTNEPEVDGDESGIDVEYKEKWISSARQCSSNRS